LCIGANNGKGHTGPTAPTSGLTFRLEDGMKEIDGKRIIRISLAMVWAVFIGAMVCLAAVAIMLAVAACTPAPTPIPGPDYRATLDGVSAEATLTAADYATCGEAWYNTMGALNECLLRPTPLPVIVTATAIPTATPDPLVSCENKPEGTIVVIHTRTTVRGFHQDNSDNLGQAEAGERAILIDTWYDTGTGLRWIKADWISTNDYPDGIRGYVKETYAGCEK
jgi:hypothetical protein